MEIRNLTGLTQESSPPPPITVTHFNQTTKFIFASSCLFSLRNQKLPELFRGLDLCYHMTDRDGSHLTQWKYLIPAPLLHSGNAHGVSWSYSPSGPATWRSESSDILKWTGVFKFYQLLIWFVLTKSHQGSKQYLCIREGKTHGIKAISLCVNFHVSLLFLAYMAGKIWSHSPWNI